MKKEPLERLMQSLGEVRDHAATARFAGGIREVEIDAGAIRDVRERSGMTQSRVGMQATKRRHPSRR
jgi:hypothetical protein